MCRNQAHVDEVKFKIEKKPFFFFFSKANKCEREKSILCVGRFKKGIFISGSQVEILKGDPHAELWERYVDLATLFF